MHKTQIRTEESRTEGENRGRTGREREREGEGGEFDSIVFGNRSWAGFSTA